MSRWTKEKEKRDIKRFKKEYPELDIVETAYDKKGELTTFAVSAVDVEAYTWGY